MPTVRADHDPEFVHEAEEALLAAAAEGAPEGEIADLPLTTASPDADKDKDDDEDDDDFVDDDDDDDEEDDDDDEDEEEDDDDEEEDDDDDDDEEEDDDDDDDDDLDDDDEEEWPSNLMSAKFLRPRIWSMASVRGLCFPACR